MNLVAVETDHHNLHEPKSGCETRIYTLWQSGRGDHKVDSEGNSQCFGAADFDKSATIGHLMSLRVSGNAIAGYLMRYDSLIDVVDALSYVREVRDTFLNQMEKYEMFIDIMKDLKARRTKSLNIYQRIDIVGVIEKVKELFKGHPSLILGFNAFMPNGCEKIIQDQDQAPPKKTTYKEQTLKSMEQFREDVYDTTPFKQPFCSSHEKFRTNVVDPLSYVREVRDTFPNQMEKYEMFIDIIKDFKARRTKSLNISHRIDTAGVVTKVKELFKGHPSLILGFYAFIPNGYEKIINDEDQAPPKKTTYKEQALKSMELLREDVNDTPPFQRPFFSSHNGEL
ncbi:hypothetical protein MTR67_044652 [Solanum verrucosum]|uniref:Paired amphipathic helix protein Sin3-like 2 n=1 Tax=Solanum verrucosum TaxID=315347 RepID=A0AAF0URY0_SOLVR|nr:hypothetical protein MTR67_044652 [Solanum verrucosum]